MNQSTVERLGRHQPSRRAPGATAIWFADTVKRLLADRGCIVEQDGGSSDQGVAFYPIDPRAPRGYRRRSRAIFVVGVAEVDAEPDDVLRAGYPLLVRSLANVFVLLVCDRGENRISRAHFTTLEQGCYTVEHGGDDAAFFARVVQRLTPLATSTLVIGNEFQTDLPPELWEGDAHTAAMSRAGRRLDAMNLLPAPFPLQEILPPRDFRHVQQLFGLGGLSYGNLSVRYDRERFWMSASGVDKSRLCTVGEEILLVKGYQPATRTMLLSVPPHRQPRRVSVDAIEHWMIYCENPGVGAIVHVHAWIDGAMSTEVNYPCGTLELATEVADLVRRAPDPNRAIIGLKNHGLTVTGPNLDEIFERIHGRILRQVPMS